MSSSIEKADQQDMPDLQEYLRQKAATIGNFIDYLNKHFRPEDKVCWIDCVEGCRYDALPLQDKDLGKQLFRCIRDIKKQKQLNGWSEKETADLFPMWMRAMFLCYNFPI